MYILWVHEATIWPTDIARNAMPPFPELGLLASHARIIVPWTMGAPIVSHEKNNRVVPQAFIGKELYHRAHVGINIAHHTQVVRETSFQIGIHVPKFRLPKNVGDCLFIFILSNQWSVWSVGHNDRKERVFILGSLLHERHSLFKENVCAVAFILLPLPIVHIGVVKVVITPIVGNGSYVG